MNAKTIAAALQILKPGAQWILQGETLAGLTWIDNVQSRPTDADITAQIGA